MSLNVYLSASPLGMLGLIPLCLVLTWGVNRVRDAHGPMQLLKLIFGSRYLVREDYNISLEV